MRKVAVALAMIVGALGLVACGGGSSSTSSTDSTSSTTAKTPTLADEASPEVKAALVLIGKRERLHAEAAEGFERAAAIQQRGASAAMEEAAIEFAEKEEEVEAELEALKGNAANRAYMIFNAEH